LSKVIKIIGAKPLINVPKIRATKAWKNLVKCAQRKRMAKKNFKEVSQVCPNKKKGAKKSLKEVLLSLPKKQSSKRYQKKFKRSLFESAPKRMSEKVPKQFLKCAQTGKKKSFTSHLIPYFLL
jgi:hypothetical protein